MCAQRKRAMSHSTMKNRTGLAYEQHTYNLRNMIAGRIDRTCVVVMALCNQPEAFTSDLGDD